MRRLWLAISAVWVVAYVILDWYGRLQIARDLFQNQGRVVKMIIAILTSQWLPIGLFVAAVAVLAAIRFDLFPSKKKRNNGLIQPALQSRRLQIACHPSIEGCVAEVLWTINHKPLPVKFFRVAVNAVGEDQSVKNCTGFLRRIEKNGKTKWGGNKAQLTFAQGEEPDALSKIIRHPAPEYLDVLVVTSRNQIFPGTKPITKIRSWPFVPGMDEIFSEPGDYLLTLAITGDGVPAITALLEFTWTQNWQTAALTLIFEPSAQSAPQLKTINPEIELQPSQTDKVPLVTEKKPPTQ